MFKIKIVLCNTILVILAMLTILAILTMLAILAMDILLAMLASQLATTLFPLLLLLESTVEFMEPLTTPLWPMPTSVSPKF